MYWPDNSAWSLPTVGASGVTSANGQASQGHFSLNASSKGNFGNSPNLRGSGEFYAVAAVSANDMWAVGDGIGTLIEHWNGTQWSIVTSPSPGSTGTILNSVAAISASDAWTVGIYSNNQYASHSLVEHWDGSAWSVVTSPNVG